MKNPFKNILYITIANTIIFVSCNSKENAHIGTPQNETINHIDTLTKSINNTEQEIFSFDLIKSKKISDFIPEGYLLLDTSYGDLNLDNYTDLILILKTKIEEDYVEAKRPLLILTGDEKGFFTLKKQNNNSVLCYDCGGIFGDPYEGITIKNGYFSIEHFGGSSWKWTLIITYKYLPEKKDWYLYKYGGESFHSLNIKDTKKKKVNTTEDFGEILFEDFNIDKAFD